MRTPARFLSFGFFFSDTGPPEIYTLSLHDALPISSKEAKMGKVMRHTLGASLNIRHNLSKLAPSVCRDRKSGSAGMPRPSSYAVFCLKKKIDLTTTIPGSAIG